MATPNERLLLDNVLTTLQTISVTNGYKTNVDAVELKYRTWVSKGEVGATVIGIVPMDAVWTPQAFGHYRVRLNIMLACHVQASSDSERYDRLQDLIDDVVAALNVDINRGGTAICTVITAVRTDMGDPDTIDVTGGSGVAAIQFFCDYDRTDQLS